MKNRTIIFLFLTSIATGCTSLKVKRIDPEKPATANASGIRYSLPKPFIRATPKPDGSVEVDVVYLPDRDATYAINAWSAAADHTLNVTVKQGFLQSVQFKADTTAVASQAVQSSGNLASKEIDKQAKEATDAQAAGEAAAKALIDAELAEKVAEAKYNALVHEGAGTDRKADAFAEWEVAKVRLAALQGVAKSSRGGGASPTTIPTPPPLPNLLPDQKVIKLRGPVLFAINERGADSVELEAVKSVLITGSSDAQPTFITTTKPAKAVSNSPKISPEDVKLSYADATRTATLSVYSSAELDAVLALECKLEWAVQTNVPQPITPPIALDTSDKKHVHVNLNGIAQGRYKLTLTYTFPVGNTNEKASSSVDLTILN